MLACHETIRKLRHYEKMASIGHLGIVLCSQLESKVLRIVAPSIRKSVIFPIFCVFLGLNQSMMELITFWTGNCASELHNLDSKDSLGWMLLIVYTNWTLIKYEVRQMDDSISSYVVNNRRLYAAISFELDLRMTSYCWFVVYVL